MSRFDPKLGSALAYYHCTACDRAFVAGTHVRAKDLMCLCGHSLRRVAMPRGLHQLEARSAHTSQIVQKSMRSESPRDLGYGASHGYGANHGGPTGPGDAPARLPDASDPEAAASLRPLARARDDKKRRARTSLIA